MVRIAFVCCVSGQKTGGKKHDRKCTGVPPRLINKKRLFLTKDGQVASEELPPETLYLVDMEQLIGAEIKDGEIMMADQRKFTITLESQFIPTPTMVKQKLGTGYRVIAVELDREAPKTGISDVESAVYAILYTGYRALARAYHPDLGGDQETMMILNKAKKEIDDLIKAVKSQ